jgi:hypothetical protein
MPKIQSDRKDHEQALADNSLPSASFPRYTLKRLALIAAVAGPIGGLASALAERFWLEHKLPKLINSPTTTLDVSLPSVFGSDTSIPREELLNRAIFNLDIRRGPRGEQITASELDSLLKSLPNLTRLKINGPIKLSDQKLASLRELHHLKMLQLIDLPLIGKFAGFLANSPISDLVVERCSLDINSLEILSRLPKLTSLSVAHTGLSAESLSVIKQMPYLTSLNLQGNQILGRDIPALRSAPRLQWITINSSAIKDPSDLSALQRMVANDGRFNIIILHSAGGEEFRLDINAKGSSLQSLSATREDFYIAADNSAREIDFSAFLRKTK